MIEFAREKGYFSGKDADFSFRDAYCPIDFENVRYADARVWSFFRHHYDEAEMDKTVDEIKAAFDRTIPDGYTIDVGRYSKYRPSLHDYRSA